MAQIKIYLSSSKIAQVRDTLSLAIHECSIKYLGLPENKKFHRFIPLDQENFICPEDRTDNYIIIEIHMFSGRKLETKKNYIKGLISTISDKLNISKNDIEITLHESPAEHWGIRGQTGDELILNYKVNK